jgi:hypothetical protein
LQHLVGSQLRMLDDQAKAAREVAAHHRARDAEKAERELKKGKGWL